MHDSQELGGQICTRGRGVGPLWQPGGEPKGPLSTRSQAQILAPAAGNWTWDCGAPCATATPCLVREKHLHASQGLIYPRPRHQPRWNGDRRVHTPSTFCRSKTIPIDLSTPLSPHPRHDQKQLQSCRWRSQDSAIGIRCRKTNARLQRSMFYSKRLGRGCQSHWVSLLEFVMKEPTMQSSIPMIQCHPCRLGGSSVKSSECARWWCTSSSIATWN